jgi:tRNA modification GTPase
MKRQETVFAISSGQGRAGVAVLRVCGAKAADAFAVFGVPVPRARRATVARLFLPDGSVLDECLVLWFPAPHSVTGENMAEFHVHGSSAIVASVLDRWMQLEGWRLAVPGEFTRIAYENGRMDLLQVEGLSDVLFAESEPQRQLAMRQFLGESSGQYEAWRNTALRALGLVEAAIDFSDEGDVGEKAFASALEEVVRLRGILAEALAASETVASVRRGIRVVIAGPTNAGKSSLLNWLAGRDVAIVAPSPGTTRDTVETQLMVAGVPILIADTAGLRLPADAAVVDAVEAEGIRRSHVAARAADILVWVEATDGPSAEPPRAVDILVASKCDLAVGDGSRLDRDGLRLSVKTGEGLGTFRLKLETLIRQRNEVTESSVVVRIRHRDAVENSLRWLERASEGDVERPELVADDIRRAAQALSVVTNGIGSEDVLGEIFGEFCIGK